MRIFSGPSKNNGRIPTNSDPLGPGILSDNIFFLLFSNLIIMISTKKADSVMKTKYHILVSLKSITCEQNVNVLFKYIHTYILHVKIMV